MSLVLNRSPAKAGAHFWIPAFAGTRVSFFALLFLAGLSFSTPVIENAFGISSTASDLSQRFLDPSVQHFLGTDELGRDVFLRLLYGGQVSLTVGFLGALLSTLIGTAIGLVSGWNAGRVDAFLMRFTDLIIALPLLPLLIILAALDPAKLGVSEIPDMLRIIIIVSLFGWPTVARLVRAGTLSAKERVYVTAARALGVTPRQILTRHILPNIAAPVVVAATLAAGNIILLESVLSFLGLGIQPPQSSWGNMLAHAQDIIWDKPLLALWPGLMIFLTVICLNVAGDALSRRG